MHLAVVVRTLRPVRSVPDRPGPARRAQRVFKCHREKAGVANEAGMLLTATLVAALALLARPQCALAADKQVDSNKVADDDPFTWLTDDAVVIESAGKWTYIVGASPRRYSSAPVPSFLSDGPLLNVRVRYKKKTSNFYFKIWI